MDGLKDTVPHGKPYEEFCQMTIFDMLSDTVEEEEKPEVVPCRIYNWRKGNSVIFKKLKEN